MDITHGQKEEISSRVIPEPVAIFSKSIFTSRSIIHFNYFMIKISEDFFMKISTLSVFDFFFFTFCSYIMYVLQLWNINDAKSKCIFQSDGEQTADLHLTIKTSCDVATGLHSGILRLKDENEIIILRYSNIEYSRSVLFRVSVFHYEHMLFRSCLLDTASAKKR